jgi:DNA-binding CsgD family transcriptional regulator
VTSAERARARARELIDEQQWDEAYATLAKLDESQSLAADDLERLAISAQMLGHNDEAASAWIRAHTAYVAEDQTLHAARCAYWVVIPMLFRGEMAKAGGWIARTQRMLESAPRDDPARGYLLCATALHAVRKDDAERAHADFVEAARIGDRVRDADLIAHARHGQGRTLIRLGEHARGAALLDEVMATIIPGAVSPLIVGGIYCSVLEACNEMYDLRRAQEWTDALTAWCARQPEAIAFRGQCLVHRAELMQLHGAWPSAIEEAERAREKLLRPPPHRAIGTAYYRIAELHRLRGDFVSASDAYAEASRAGLDPQPGMALLRLAQGQTTAARTAISRAVEEAGARRGRARLMPAYVEIAIASHDLTDARSMAEELVQLAEKNNAQLLRATAAHALGSVRLAEGDARGALALLREAFARWQSLEMPYDAARTRVLLSRACAALGDKETAAMELACARETFMELGAQHDLERLDRASHATEDAGSEHGLTSREVEVLRLVATGKTNRAIARTLGISEKTVARHVSNIFTKLGLASRAAATAYAYERRIVQGST